MSVARRTAASVDANNNNDDDVNDDATTTSTTSDQRSFKSSSSRKSTATAATTRSSPASFTSRGNRGGGGNTNNSSSIHNNNNSGGSFSASSSSSLFFSPRGNAVLAMSLSLAIHLGGYELARAAVMALFTSDGLGFGKGGGAHDDNTDNNSDSAADNTIYYDSSNTNEQVVSSDYNDNGNGNDNQSHGEVEGGLSALPMAVGCVSPFSVALLWFYAKTLHFGGPAYALRFHTLICAGVQIAAGWVLGTLDTLLKAGGGLNIGDNNVSSAAGIVSISQPLLFLLFVAQNAYVQLLYAQHWAFISSVLTAEEGTKIFAPIAGLGSIGSTLAAGLVSVLVDKLGLVGLLFMAGASYVASAFMADVAFGLARRHGFEPNGVGSGSGGKEQKEEDFKEDKNTTTTATAASSKKEGKEDLKFNNEDIKTNTNDNDTEKEAKLSSSTSPLACCKKGGLFQQAHALFKRVPALEALFIEVVVSQCLSSLVNFIYLYKLKATITDDSQRAGWSGNFYAWINGVSGIFQFFIIPILLKYCEAHRIWIVMPTIMLCCVIYQFATHTSSGLFGASASFFAIKTMEYSLRGAANEMLYVNLDYESRYLGKKVISLIAGKFGKSAMAVALSLVMVMYGEKTDMMWYLLMTAMVFTHLWLFSSVRLHSLIESGIKR